MVVKGDLDRFAYDVAFVRSDMCELVAELEGAGVPVHDLGAHGDFELGWLVRLRRLLVAQRYDVLHAHSPYAAGLARLVTRTLRPSRRPRLVFTEHSAWDHDTLPSRVLGQTTSHWDDVRIAVAHSNRDALPSRLRRRTRVIRHGIDLEHASVDGHVDTAALRAELGVPPEHFLVVSVANLRPQKGYPTLLTAARILQDQDFPVTILAVGTGALTEVLEGERVRLGLGDRFRFLGQRSDAGALIAAADVMVLASDWECMPVVVMEAFALGTPIVASAVGELPLVIDSGTNGVLVPPGDPDRLAATLRGVLTDAALRESLARGAADSAEQFDVHHARKEVEGVYAELVAR